MKTKGQIAFESLLVLLIVISAVIMITTLYLQFHNETVALGYARTGALEELSKQEKNIIIEKITVQKNATTSVITINVDKTPTIDINTIKIENMITTNTGLKNVQVLVTVRQ